MSGLRTPDHSITNTPGSEGTVSGVDGMCYGTSISLPPSDPKEHIQHYGKTMYTGDMAVIEESKQGEMERAPSTGSVTLPDKGDTRHTGAGKGNTDPTPAMPGA